MAKVWVSMRPNGYQMKEGNLMNPQVHREQVHSESTGSKSMQTSEEERAEEVKEESEEFYDGYEDDFGNWILDEEEK